MVLMFLNITDGGAVSNVPKLLRLLREDAIFCCVNNNIAHSLLCAIISILTQRDKDMALTVRDLLVSLELDHLLDNATAEDEQALDANVEVHQQQNYPLKGTLANVKLVDGTVQLASGTASEYGDRDAWEQYEGGEW